MLDFRRHVFSQLGDEEASVSSLNATTTPIERYLGTVSNYDAGLQVRGKRAARERGTRCFIYHDKTYKHPINVYVCFHFFSLTKSYTVLNTPMASKKACMYTTFSYFFCADIPSLLSQIPPGCADSNIPKQGNGVRWLGIWALIHKTSSSL